MSENRKDIGGLLLIYHCPIAKTPAFIEDHIDSFREFSRHDVRTINTELGFPDGLEEFEFQVLVLSFTLFAWKPFFISQEFREYIQKSRAYKVAFFQDEYRFWPERSEFINGCNIDCVYTNIEPPYFDETYRRFTSAKKVVHYIPGYVSTRQIENGLRSSRPDSEREIDIGYRGRPTYHYMGKGAREKNVIATKFAEFAAGSGLVLDIEAAEERRIYGGDWLRFLGNCRGVLGVEAGVSIFDLNDEMRPRYEKIMAERPDISFDEISRLLLDEYEDKGVYNRMISPRVFEAASVRACQILFEGRYTGILVPDVHYIPLKKDFSNIDDVIRKFRDPGIRKTLSDNAFRDLIESGKYSYKAFVEEFDRKLSDAGIVVSKDPAVVGKDVELLILGHGYRRLFDLVALGEEKYLDTLRPYVALQHQYMAQQQQLADLMAGHIDLQGICMAQQQRLVGFLSATGPRAKVLRGLRKIKALLTHKN
ncbi:MAG TPA: hypothetical protein DCQ94_04840 [Nitrospira sp.]|nr:hypothetical protein [Nitrospira sp.]